LEVQRNTKKLASLQIREDEDLSLETRNTRQGLIPFLNDAKESGLRAFLRKDKLVVEGRTTYDLNYVAKNIQPGVEGNGLDIPARNSVEESEEISQQRTGNTGSDYTNHRTLQLNKYI
jgi:hypothetical protein